MKAIHGGKAKNDKIDSHKIAALLRGGLPAAGRHDPYGICISLKDEGYQRPA